MTLPSRSSRHKTTVLGFGTFDGLHPGHLFFLNELKKCADESILVLARDVNVKKIKGKPARRNELERLQAVQKAGLVDHAELGDQNDFYKCIRTHRPDIICLGYDQKANLERIRAEFPDIKVVRLPALEPEKYKSSLLNL